MNNKHVKCFIVYFLPLKQINKTGKILPLLQRLVKVKEFSPKTVKERETLYSNSGLCDLSRHTPYRAEQGFWSGRRGSTKAGEITPGAPQLFQAPEPALGPLGTHSLPSFRWRNWGLERHMSPDCSHSWHIFPVRCAWTICDNITHHSSTLHQHSTIRWASLSASFFLLRTIFCNYYTRATSLPLFQHVQQSLAPLRWSIFKQRNYRKMQPRNQTSHLTRLMLEPETSANYNCWDHVESFA